MKIRSSRGGLILLLAVIVAAGLGLVIVRLGGSSGPTALHTVPGKRGPEYVAGDRGEPDGEAGEEKGEEDPAAYADEQYAARAYPESEIPFTASLNAMQAWSQKKAGKNSPGQWTLAG